MKKAAFIESPYCEYDPSLDDDEKRNPNPFPQKMARAIAFFEKNGLPPGVERSKKYIKKRKKPTLSTLQNELLKVFAIEPTEKQMLELKDFLYQLFGDEILKSKLNQEEKIAA